MKILKINSMKKRINDKKKDLFEMKLINKIKKIKNIISATFKLRNVSIIIKIKCNETCIY